MKIDSLIAKQVQLDTLTAFKTDTTNKVASLIDKTHDSLILGMPEGFARILIPVAVTVVIFFLGHFISWLKLKFERRKEVSSYKNLILKWIELISKSIEAQITNCNTFATNLENSEDMSPIRLSVSKLLAEKIDALPLEKILNAFSINTTGDKSKNYVMTYNLISQFNFLRHVEPLIIENFEAYVEVFDGLAKRWNLLFSEFDDTISVQSKELANKAEHPNLRFHNQVRKIVNDWMKTPPTTNNSVKYTDEKLIKPLIILTAHELDLNQSDYAFKISRVIRDLNVELIQWDNAKKVNAGLFRSIATTTKDSYQKLQEVNLYFKNETRTSNIFRIK